MTTRGRAGVVPGRLRSAGLRRWIGTDQLPVTVAVRWMLVVSAVDALLEDRIVLPELLGIAPLMAAFGARGRATLLVGASAIGCAIALGLPDHEFLTARHLVTVAMISAVALLATWTARDRSDLRAAQALADRRAAHDALTGLLNRGAVVDRVAALVRLRPEVRPTLAVVLADLDHFKRINDNLGHTVGDEVLQAVGRRLTDAVRAGDLVGRYGGEEFIVFLAGASAGAPDPVDRLVKAIGEAPFQTSAGRVSVTLSAGWALLEHDVSIEEAIRRADEALYQAKAAGRNQSRRWRDTAGSDQGNHRSGDWPQRFGDPGRVLRRYAGEREQVAREECATAAMSAPMMPP